MTKAHGPGGTPEEDTGGSRGGGSAPDARRDEPTGSGGRAGTPEAGPPICDLCGGPMLERHCRIVCTTCGYQRDCSDP